MTSRPRPDPGDLDWTAAEAGLHGLAEPAVVEKLRAVRAFLGDDATPGEDDPYIAQLHAALAFAGEAATLPDGAERYAAWSEVYPYLAAPAVNAVEPADALAAAAHRGQVDKSGAEYIAHPRAVAAIVREHGGDTAQQVAALLHDVVEDTAATLGHLADLGVPTRVLRLVDALTARPGEPRQEYLRRVLAEPDAVPVKRADIAHNASPERLARLDEAMRARLRRKYAESLELLRED